MDRITDRPFPWSPLALRGFHFETPEASASGDPAPADPAPVQDPGVTAGGDPDPATPSAADGGGQPSGEGAPPTLTPELLESPAFTEAVYAAAQGLLEQHGYRQGEPQPADEPAGFELPELDPFSDSFTDDLARRDETLLRYVLEGVQGMIQPLVAERQQSIETAGRTDAVGRIGSAGVDLEGFEDVAWSMVRSEFSELAGRFGGGDHTAEMAVHRVAERLKTRDARIAEKAVAAYQQRIREASGHPQDGGVGGAGAEVRPQPKGYDAIIARYRNREPNRLEAYNT